MKRLTIALSSIVLAALLLTACDLASAGDDTSATDPTATPPRTEPTTADPAGQPTVIRDASPTAEPTSIPPPTVPSPPASGMKPPPPTGSAPLPPGSERVLAPIESVQVLVLESFPQQYNLRVVAGLPNGCARPAGHEVSRSGNTIRVLVFNSRPTGMVACTQVYGTHELTVSLGSDFVSGIEYAVTVNDRSESFRAQ